MNRCPEITAKTKEKIISAFWQFYKEKKIENIHIGEITELAGYRRITFYEYFKDIYDLLEQEENALLNELKTCMCITVKSHEQIYDVINQFCQENGEKLGILIERDYRSFFVKLKGIIYPLFLKKYNLQDDTPIALFYEFEFSGYLSSFYYWFNHQDQISIEELASTLQTLFKNGY